MIQNLEGPVWGWLMLCVACLVTVMGSLGNLLTLAAVPYVRRRYPSEFSLLQLPITDLLINLSVSDLIFCSIALPHLIHGMAVGENLYAGWPSLQIGTVVLDFCKLHSMIRTTAMVADFCTIGAISVWLACHYLCRGCRRDGNSLNHHQHGWKSSNKLLKSEVRCFPEETEIIKATKMVIFGIWIISIAAALLSATGLNGQVSMQMAGTVFTCSSFLADSDKHKTTYVLKQLCYYAVPVVVVLNLAVMVVSYSLVFWQTRQYTSQPYSEPGHRKSSHTVMLVVLSLTYTFCLVPAVATFWGLKNYKYWGKVGMETISASIYWSMYGINFLLYLATSSRMRDMYWRFLSDMWTKLVCQGASSSVRTVPRALTSLSCSSVLPVLPVLPVSRNHTSMTYSSVLAAAGPNPEETKRYSSPSYSMHPAF